MTVYLIWEEHAMMMGSVLVGVYANKELAEQDAKNFLNTLSLEERPEFDSYGQISGINYTIVEMKVIE